MSKPLRINEFDKPVYQVNNLHIKKVENGYDKYELQLNGEYYELSEQQLEAISQIRFMDEKVGISMG